MLGPATTSATSTTATAVTTAATSTTEEFTDINSVSECNSTATCRMLQVDGNNMSTYGANLLQQWCSENLVGVKQSNYFQDLTVASKCKTMFYNLRYIHNY